MNKPLRHPLIDLPRNATLRIDDGRPHHIAVFEGQVWLTQEGDPRDIILEAGEGFTLDRPGLALVQAFRDARLLLCDPAALDPDARRPDAYELQRRARAQRDAAVAALVARAFAAAESTVLRAARRLAPASLATQASLGRHAAARS